MAIQPVMRRKHPAPLSPQKPKKVGVVDDGTKFEIPKTFNSIEVLYTPRALATPAVLIEVVVLLWIVASMFFPVAKEWHIAQFLFWRFMYNGFIGWLLRAQSSSNLMTRKFDEYKDQRFVKWFIESSALVHSDTPFKYDISKFPTEYSAWLSFRSVVNVILGADLAAYLVFALVYRKPFLESFDMVDAAMYSLGLGLALLALWGKSDAHRQIGDYAWYWGDFFFKLDGVILNFSGVFKIFPHPMYTVGYAFYYSSALFSRSWVVFGVSVFAHLCQMAFLVWAEQPHMDKIYGTEENTDSPTARAKAKIGVMRERAAGLARTVEQRKDRLLQKRSL